MFPSPRLSLSQQMSESGLSLVSRCGATPRRRHLSTDSCGALWNAVSSFSVQWSEAAGRWVQFQQSKQSLGCDCSETNVAPGGKERIRRWLKSFHTFPSGNFRVCSGLEVAAFCESFLHLEVLKFEQTWCLCLSERIRVEQRESNICFSASVINRLTPVKSDVCLFNTNSTLSLWDQNSNFRRNDTNQRKKHLKRKIWISQIQ